MACKNRAGVAPPSDGVQARSPHAPPQIDLAKRQLPGPFPATVYQLSEYQFAVLMEFVRTALRAANSMTPPPDETTH